MRTKKHKTFLYLSYVIIATAQLLLLAIIFTAFYPFKVVTFSKFEATKEVYQQGEPICVDMKFDKHRDFRGNVRWVLIDGFAYELYAGSINRGRGEDTALRCFDVNVPSNDYSLRVEIEYNLLGGLRRILVAEETNKFTIK